MKAQCALAAKNNAAFLSKIRQQLNPLSGVGELTPNGHAVLPSPLDLGSAEGASPPAQGGHDHDGKALLRGPLDSTDFAGVV